MCGSDAGKVLEVDERFGGDVLMECTDVLQYYPAAARACLRRMRRWSGKARTGCGLTSGMFNAPATRTAASFDARACHSARHAGRPDHVQVDRARAGASEEDAHHRFGSAHHQHRRCAAESTHRYADAGDPRRCHAQREVNMPRRMTG